MQATNPDRSRARRVLATILKRRRDAAAAVIAAAVMTTATIMLALAVVPAVAMGGGDGFAAPTHVPAQASASPITAVTSRGGAMPGGPQAKPAAPHQFVTHGIASADQSPEPPKSSAKSPAHATQVAKAAPKTRKSAVAKTAPVLSGANHFWFPALGISDAVRQFNCAGSYVIPGGIWHFGCNGPHNIYLMSHAWSDFRAVRVAYHDGGLKAGMTAYYAGANGKVQRYKVVWIRHVTVESFNANYWEWAINDVPAVTLQTCDGANSEYRIIVRLVRG